MSVKRTIRGEMNNIICDVWEYSVSEHTEVDAMRAKLKRYEERETLVQELLVWVAPHEGEWVGARDVDDWCRSLGERLRDFKLE